MTMSSNLTLSVLLKYIFCCMFHKDTNVCNICISSRLRMIYQNYDSLEITYCFSATTHLKPIWSVRKLDSDRFPLAFNTMVYQSVTYKGNGNWWNRINRGNLFELFDSYLTKSHQKIINLYSCESFMCMCVCVW